MADNEPVLRPLRLHPIQIAFWQPGDHVSVFVTSIHANDNHRAATVLLAVFHGIPPRVRGDHGTESVRVAQWMEERSGVEHSTYIWGRWVLFSIPPVHRAFCSFLLGKKKIVFSDCSLQKCTQYSRRASLVTVTNLVSVVRNLVWAWQHPVLYLLYALHLDVWDFSLDFAPKLLFWFAESFILFSDFRLFQLSY